MSSLVLLSNTKKPFLLKDIIREFNVSDDIIFGELVDKIDYNNHNVQNVGHEEHFLEYYKESADVVSVSDSSKECGTAFRLRSMDFMFNVGVTVQNFGEYVDISGSIGLGGKPQKGGGGTSFLLTAGVKEVQGAGIVQPEKVTTIYSFKTCPLPKKRYYISDFFPGEGSLSPVIMRRFLLEYFTVSEDEVYIFYPTSWLAFFKTGGAINLLRRFNLPFVEV